MSIESDLSSIAKSLELIAAAMTSKSVQSIIKAEIVAAPVAEQPVPKAVEVVAPVVASTLIVPVAVPVSVAPVVASISKDEFVAMVMSTYKALGPVKGQAIQEILLSVGAKNINDVPADKYTELADKIKAL